MRQDVESAIRRKNKVSLHMITKRDGPCYHAGVDTIDGFCYSWHKKLTPEELDRVYADFLEKEQGKSDPVQQDEKDSAEESLANLNLQPGAQDQSHEDLADLVGEEIVELYYNGDEEPKKFNL